MAADFDRRDRQLRFATLALLTMAVGFSVADCAMPRGERAGSGPDSSRAAEPTVLSEYEGVVPCASCPGIRMRLKLYTGTPLYRLRETYLGEGAADSVRESEGQWTTVYGMEGNPDAIVYQLAPDDPERTRSFVVVNDGEIQMLDRDRKPIASEHNYSLLRLPLPPDPLGGRSWMWVALVRGDSLTPVDHPERYTLTTPSPGMFALQADCNRGRARYRMSGTEITVGPIAMTFAMCAEGSRGEEFARLIGGAVKMEMVGDTLEVGLKGGGGMRMVEGVTVSRE